MDNLYLDEALQNLMRYLVYKTKKEKTKKKEKNNITSEKRNILIPECFIDISFLVLKPNTLSSLIKSLNQVEHNTQINPIKKSKKNFKLIIGRLSLIIINIFTNKIKISIEYIKAARTFI